MTQLPVRRMPDTDQPTAAGPGRRAGHTGPALRNHRLFLVALATGGVAIAVYAAAPSHPWEVGAWVVSLLLPAGILTVRMRRVPSVARVPLVFLLAGGLLKLTGALGWYVAQRHGHGSTSFPTALDVVFLLVYVCRGAFLLTLLKRRGGGRPGAGRVVLIDALIMAMAGFAPLWVWGLEPRLHHATLLSGAAAAVFSGVTLVLFALAVRLALAPGFARTALAPLTLIWTAALVVGDTVYAVRSAGGAFGFGGSVVLAWMVSRTAVAGLAAYPGADRLLQPAPGSDAHQAPPPSTSRTRSRYHVVLLAAALVPVATEVARGGAPSGLLVASAASFILLTYRGSLLAGDLDAQTRLAGELNDAVQQLAEQRDELARYATIVSSADDAIVTTSADGLIVDWNRGAERLYGCTRPEALGRRFAAIATPGEPELLEETMTLAGERGSASVEAVDVRADGSAIHTSLTVTNVYDDDADITAVVVIARDITAQKARHADIERESKLESLGRLSAGLAHEINSPIQFVGDNARFLEEAYRELIRVVEVYRELLDSTAPISWAERQERVREAEASIDFDFLQTEIPGAVAQTLVGIERVSTIVRAMKTFSHPGHQEQVHADLNEALEATLTVSRHQIKEIADLELALGDLPPVRCNIADLNQVFLNLIVNAADAIEETGRRGVISVSTRLDGQEVVIAISDTGRGIPDAIRSKIFDPFFTTKGVGRGSGQGLPLARGVVQDGHGGTLTLDNTPGAGTTFTIRLPIDGRQPGEPAAVLA